MSRRCTALLAAVAGVQAYNWTNATASPANVSKETASPWGNATASPWGNETDSPWGNETDSPWGNETASPWGNETASPWGNETDSPWGNETDSPWGNATASPWGNASASPWGNETASPWGNETASPWGNETASPWGNETDSPWGNETASPWGNETDSPWGNETASPWGNETASPWGNETASPWGNETDSPWGNETASPWGNETASPWGNETASPWGNETASPWGNETASPWGNETASPWGNETASPWGNETDSPWGNETASPWGNETDSPWGNETASPWGNETDSPWGNETASPWGNETASPWGNETDSPWGNETASPWGNETASPWGNETASPWGNETASPWGNETASPWGNETASPWGNETDSPWGNETASPWGNETASPWGNETDSPWGNETASPWGNETDSPWGNETASPWGNETASPWGNETDSPWGNETASPWGNETNAPAQFTASPKNTSSACTAMSCPPGTTCVDSAGGAICKGDGTPDSIINRCMQVDQLSAEAVRECCKFGFGCPTNPFDCMASNASAWGPQEKHFCCQMTTDARGCAQRCPVARSARQGSDGYCCDVRGNCNEEYFAYEQAIDAKAQAQRKEVRVNVRGMLGQDMADTGDVLQNPKGLLRRLRLQLLAASEDLREKPERLMVTLLGLLQADGSLPTAGEFQSMTVPVPEKWNRALLNEESTLSADGWLTSRAGQVLESSTSSKNAKKVFFEYTIEGTDAAKVEKAVHQAAAVGEGVTVMTPPPSPESDGGLKTLWIVLGAGLGALCLGGLVAALVVSQRRKSEDVTIAHVLETCEVDELSDVRLNGDYTEKL